MFARVSCLSSWRSDDDEPDIDPDCRLSHSYPSDVDSEAELRNVEELLYSQVHYVSNVSCKDTNNDEDELVVTDIDIACIKPCHETCELAHPELNSTKPEESTYHKPTSSLLEDSYDFHKPSAKETEHLSKFNDFEVTALDSDCEVVVSTKPPSSCKQAHKFETPALNEGLLRSVGRSQFSTSSLKTSAPNKPVITVDSSSTDSSYDAFFYDDSSLDSDEAAEGDTQINFVEDAAATSAASALKKVLKMLPDCNWDVVDIDRVSNSIHVKGGARYYLTKTRCHNCNMFGHLASECTITQKLYACLLCGQRGHIARLCAKALCFVCHMSGHAVRECPYKKKRFEYCDRCDVRGHFQMTCPDKWRQYHLTTSGDQLVVGNNEVNENRFCYNCSGKGHFGHECCEERGNHYTVASLPLVAKYDGHFYDHDKRGKSRQKGAYHSRRNSERNVDCSVDQDSKRPRSSRSWKSDEKKISFKLREHINNSQSMTSMSDQVMTSRTEYDFPRSAKINNGSKQPEKSSNVKDRLYGVVKTNAGETLTRNRKNFCQSFTEPGYTRESTVTQNNSSAKSDGKMSHGSMSRAKGKSPSTERMQRRLQRKIRRKENGEWKNGVQQHNSNGTVSDTSGDVTGGKKQHKRSKEYNSLQKNCHNPIETELNSCLNNDENVRLAKRRAKRRELKKKKKEQIKLEKFTCSESNEHSTTSSLRQSDTKQHTSVIKTKRGFRLTVQR